MKLKSKTTLYSSLLVLWLALIAGLLVYPLWNQVRSKSEQLQEKQEKMAEVETQSKRLKSLKQDWKKAEPDLKAVDDLFINQEAPVEYLGFLEETAANSNVEIDITAASGRKSGEPWPPAFFDVTGRGDFENCIKFLTKLESAPYLMEIQEVDLTSVQEQEQEAQTQLQLSIKVY